MAASTTDETVQGRGDPPASPSTFVAFIAKEEDFTKIPAELEGVDFTRPIAWGKHAPYPSEEGDDDGGLGNGDDDDAAAAAGKTPVAPPLPLVPVGTPPSFAPDSPALCFHVHATSGRARFATVHLPHGPVETPVFMPVGTKGALKGLAPSDVTECPALDNQIILANTYHLALQPGSELVRDLGGLHGFMGWDRNILTDSGGFQMVSLLKFAEITEEGVTFESPYDGDADPDEDENVEKSTWRGGEGRESESKVVEAKSGDKRPMVSLEDPSSPSTAIRPIRIRKRMLLRPEDSITHQNNLGSDIIMALDDVVSSVADDRTRFEIATYRTLRWLDRCHAAHARRTDQNLFPIVQGGLDTSTGGLRDRCLAGFRCRDARAPGYAIGGLAGGESKEEFWRVVDQCCRALPDAKPRYLMGVGYPIDLVVCTALGVDMYDCVYPTRTARFGVALVPGGAPGTLRLKNHLCSNDTRVIQEGCRCQACYDGLGDGGGYSRARLYTMLKNKSALAVSLVTHHNLAYMMNLNRNMREAIQKDAYGDFARAFVRDQYRGKKAGGEDVPSWVRNALASAGIALDES